MSFGSQTHLAVAVASQLRDEADVILADLDHLFADVVLGAAGYRCASPPAAVGGGAGEGGGWRVQMHCQYSRENRTIATIDPFPFQTEDDCYDGVSGKQKKKDSPHLDLFSSK